MVNTNTGKNITFLYDSSKVNPATNSDQIAIDNTKEGLEELGDNATKAFKYLNGRIMTVVISDEKPTTLKKGDVWYEIIDS